VPTIVNVEKTMTSITEIAKQFFEACETGQGWEGCQAYCTTDATFSAQAEPLAGVRTLQQYADWMQGLLTFLPDGRYELKAFGTDDERKSVCAYGVFSGTHTGQGGPHLRQDKLYIKENKGILHEVKISPAAYRRDVPCSCP
jgi:hypothetical protein